MGSGDFLETAHRLHIFVDDTNGERERVVGPCPCDGHEANYRANIAELWIGLFNHGR